MANEEHLVSRSSGSYLKVIQFDLADTDEVSMSAGLYWMMAHNEAHLILYLLPSSLFLQVGYWRGHELTVAAGKWSESKDLVTLRGIGKILSADVVPFDSSPRLYEREYMREAVEHTTTLTSENEKTGWSLLSWRGPLVYVGADFFFQTADDRLPSSWQEIGPWIRRLMDSSPVTEGTGDGPSGDSHE